MCVLTAIWLAMCEPVCGWRVVTCKDVLHCPVPYFTMEHQLLNRHQRSTVASPPNTFQLLCPTVVYLQVYSGLLCKIGRTPMDSIEGRSIQSSHLVLLYISIIGDRMVLASPGRRFHHPRLCHMRQKVIAQPRMRADMHVVASEAETYTTKGQGARERKHRNTVNDSPCACSHP